MGKLLLLCLLAMAACAAAEVCNGVLDGRCLSERTFCWNNHVYECPNSNFACKGDWGPCVAKHQYPRLPGRWRRYSCLNNHDFANGRNVKTCAPGTECWAVRSGVTPCRSKKHKGSCPDWVGNGGCINSKTYCEDGQRYKCPSGLQCAGPPRAPLSSSGVVAPCAKKLP